MILQVTTPLFDVIEHVSPLYAVIVAPLALHVDDDPEDELVLELDDDEPGLLTLVCVFE